MTTTKHFPVQSDEDLIPIIMAWRLGVPMYAWIRLALRWHRCADFHPYYTLTPSDFYYRIGEPPELSNPSDVTQS